MASLLCDELRRVHAVRAFDVVEGPEYEALALPLMIGQALNVPVISHLHSGSAVARRAMNLPETTEQRLIEAFEYACIEMADGRCAPSRQVIVDTEQAAPVGEAEVIPLPYVVEGPSQFVAPDPMAPILFLGRLEFIKGAHLLPEALNRFLANHPTATVRLVGPDTPTAPDGFGSMQNFIRSTLAAELLPRVLFLGEQPRERVTAELEACSFVLVPSLFESYSYVCCEAAGGRTSGRCGARESERREVVGDAGISFRRGDATALAESMERLASDGVLLRELAGTGISAVARRAQRRCGDRQTHSVLRPNHPSPSLRHATNIGWTALCIAGRLYGTPARGDRTDEEHGGERLRCGRPYTGNPAHAHHG